MDDLISRQAAIDAILAVTGNSSVRELYEHVQEHGLSDMWSGGVNAAIDIIIAVPSAQSDIVRCWECRYYDKPHVMCGCVRYEYSEMPLEAFDDFGTGLVSVAYGINVGGRCWRDCNMGYAEDKRVFRSADDYCSRGERKETEDETD